MDMTCWVFGFRICATVTNWPARWSNPVEEITRYGFGSFREVRLFDKNFFHWQVGDFWNLTASFLSLFFFLPHLFILLIPWKQCNLGLPSLPLPPHPPAPFPPKSFSKWWKIAPHRGTCQVGYNCGTAVCLGCSKIQCVSITTLYYFVLMSSLVLPFFSFLFCIKNLIAVGFYSPLQHFSSKFLFWKEETKKSFWNEDDTGQ